MKTIINLAHLGLVIFLAIHTSVAQNQIFRRDSPQKRPLNTVASHPQRSENPFDQEIQPDHRFSDFHSLANPSSPDSLSRAWRTEYAALNMPNWDVANAVITDPVGAVYVTGMTTQIPHGADFLTIKYDASGNPLWTATHNGPGNHDDIAQFIGLDAVGNIYVAGKSMGMDSNWDWLVLKYNPAGQELWTARYNGGENGADLPAAMAVAPNGCIYLVGQSLEAGMIDHFTTLKLTADGGQDWVYYFNAEPGSLYYGRDLVLDAAGNVYVTGDSPKLNIVTIKLNAQGTAEWISTIGDSGRFQARAIAIDSTGNVIVTGSEQTKDFVTDFVTVKYDPFGTEQWRRYHGGDYGDIPADLVVDRQGNIYVTGTDADAVYHSDYITIKYNAAGSVEWSDRFDVATRDYITPISIALDKTGMVYVTATTKDPYNLPSWVAVKLAPTGERQWTATHSSLAWATASFVDPVGNMHLVGGGEQGVGRDFTTIRFNSAGQLAWVKNFTGPNSSQYAARELALDAHGSVLVAIESPKNAGNFAVIQYDSSGQAVWLAETEPETIWRDLAGMALDAFGNVCLAGRFFDVESWDYNFGIVKFSAAGSQQWRATEKATDFVTDLEVDRWGNVIVTGTSDGNSSDYKKAITLKYNPQGKKEWLKTYHSESRNYELPTDLAVDELGNIYVAGYSRNDALNNRSHSAFLIKYHRDGALQWRKSNHESAYEWMTPSGLGVDQIGNIIINLQGTHGITTIKYDPYGNKIWQTSYPLNFSHLYPDYDNLRIDDFNCVYIFLDNGGILKYHPDGQREWVQESGIGKFTARRGGFALDTESNAYVYINDSGLANPHYLLQYDRNGTRQGVTFCNYTMNDLIVDPTGNIFATGVNAGVSWSTCVTEKYQPLTPIKPIIPTGYKLYPNYPNPFNFGTRIRYELPVSGQVTLKIYNLLGQHVATLVDGFKEKGIHTESLFLANRASGIYFCQLRVNGFCAESKMVYVK